MRRRLRIVFAAAFVSGICFFIFVSASVGAEQKDAEPNKAFLDFKELLARCKTIPLNNATLTTEQIKKQWQANYGGEFSKIVLKHFDLLHGQPGSMPPIQERFQGKGKSKIVYHPSADPCVIASVEIWDACEVFIYTPGEKRARILPHGFGEDSTRASFGFAVLGNGSFSNNNPTVSVPGLIHFCNGPDVRVAPERQILKVGDVDVSCAYVVCLFDNNSISSVTQLWISPEKGMLPIKYDSKAYKKRTGRLIVHDTLMVEKLLQSHGAWYPAISHSTSANGQQGLVSDSKVELLEVQRNVTYSPDFFERNLPKGTWVTDQIKGTGLCKPEQQ